MNKTVTSIIVGGLLLLCLPISAQDWVSMMRDRKVNIHKVQKTFNKWYEKHHKTDKDNPQAGEKEADDSYALFKRWEWYNVPRADKNGNRPDPYKIASDYDTYLRHSPAHNPSHHSLSTSTASWTYAGNTTVPSASLNGRGGDGRVNRVRTFPGNNNIMYACAPSGGLWKTTNGGGSWSNNTDQLGDLSTSDIAINPLNTNIMYLATGDGDGIQSIYPTPATIGVLKSYDGGNTWNATGLAYSLSVAGANDYSVNELLIDPNDTSVILAATTFGIFRSTNSGASWTQTQTGWFHGIEFQPGDPSIVYAGASSGLYGAGFYRSTDTGAGWTQITKGLPSSVNAEGFEIAVTAADTNVVYILADSTNTYGLEGVYRSTDQGVSFSTMFNYSNTSCDLLGWNCKANDQGDPGQGWYDLSMAVSQTNRDSLFIGGINIWASANGGSTWTLNAEWTGSCAPYVHADIHHIQFLPGTNSQGYVVGCDGGVFITSNSGTTWKDISNNLEIGQQYSIGPSASKAGTWLTGWQDNGTNFSSSPWSEVYGGDGMVCFIDWSNNNNYYAENPDGGLASSTDGGNIWNSITNGINENGPWVTQWLQDPKTSATLYAGFSNVWKSTNSGVNWSKISNWGGFGSITALAVDSANTNIMYAAQSNIIASTTNGGATWKNITGNLPVNSTSISGIAVNSKTPSHLWVTFAGYSAGNQVFASTNSGSTWTNISSGLPNLPVNCIVFESGSREGIYVGTDQGVYYRDTVLKSWVFYNTGLPMVMIGDLKIYKPGKELLAATYGRGTWETPLFPSCNLSVRASVTAKISCNGGSGSVSATLSGGVSPYTYSWSGGATASSVTGLSSGTYTVKVTDANICTSTASVSVTQPALVSVSIASKINAGCHGGTGSAVATAAAGGTSPFTYAWSSNKGTNLTATGLSAGSYTITATDHDNCTATASVTITQPAPLSISIASHTNAICNGGTGSATAMAASGGTSPYTYAWSSNKGTNLTAGSLTAGTYTITATDHNKCTASASVTITQPTAISLSIASQTNVSCYGGIGSATAKAASGGTSPYTYAWTPNGGTSLATTSLTTGTYTITATDAKHCTATASVTITQPSNPLAISIASQTNITGCSGAGSATANAATGGTSPYTYNWSPNGGTSLTTTTLTAGAYTITATDANGCKASASVTITQSGNTPSLTVALQTNVSCNGGNNASASVSAGGGTSPYIYSWSPSGGINSTAGGLTAGTYTITVTDSNGCEGNTSVTITQPTALSGSIMVTGNVVCASSNNTGLLSSAISGGTTPYTYSWSPGGQTTKAITSLSAGAYTLNVTDANGCTFTSQATITSPALLRDSISSSGCISGMGAAAVGVKGGVTPYAYSWSPIGGTKKSATGLSNGNYTVTVKDNNGCSYTTSLSISCKGEEGGGANNNSFCCNFSSMGDIITLFPNPNGGRFTIQANSERVKGKSEIEVYNVLGQKLPLSLLPLPPIPQGGLKQEGVPFTYQIDISSEPSGVYFCRVIDEKGSLVGEGKFVIER